MSPLVAWVLGQVSVSPTSSGMPGAALIQQMLNWLTQVALWGSLASILVGAAAWGLAEAATPTGEIDGVLPFQQGVVADQAGDVVERVGVGDARPEELGPVVVEDGLGPIPVERVELGEVLPQRHQGDAVAAAGGGVDGQVPQRGDVAGLVEEDEAGVGEASPPTGGRSGVVGGPDGGLDEHGEDGPQPVLLVRP